MANVAATGTSSGVASAQFQASYQAAIVSKQKEILASQGAAAIKLIQAASVTLDPQVGQNLNAQA